MIFRWIVSLWFFFSYGILHGEAFALPVSAESNAQTLWPSPLHLTPNWWSYYDVDVDLLKMRKEQAVEAFARLQSSLPPDGTGLVWSRWEKFLVGLQTLIDMKAAPVPIELISTVLPNSYTFQEWLDLGKKMFATREELRTMTLKLHLMQSSLKSGNTYVDTLFAAYLLKDSSSTSRLLEGLQIMTTRIALAIDEQQIHSLRAFFVFKEKQLAFLEQESKHARTRIDFHSVTLEEIQNEIDEIQPQVVEAHHQLLSAYDTFAGAELNIEQTVVKNDLASQQLLYAMVNDATLRVYWINLELEKEIVDGGLGKGRQTERALWQNLTMWKADIHRYAGELKDWEQGSGMHAELSLKRLSLLSDADAQGLEGAILRNTLNTAQTTVLRIQQLQSALFMNKYLVRQLHAIHRLGLTDLTDTWNVVWGNVLDFLSVHIQWFDQSLFKIGNFPVTPLGLSKVIVIIAGALVLARLTRHGIKKLGRRQQRIEQASIYILSRLAYYTILILGFGIAGASIGFDLTAFAFVAGAVTVWVGFSLQSICHNFVSGIIILLTRTLRVNDLIQLDTGEKGRVKEINLRTSILLTCDGLEIVLPNSDLVTKKFTNWTLSNCVRRLEVPFRVSLDADKAFVEQVVVSAARGVPLTLTAPEPLLWVNGYGDNYLDVSLVVWINEYLCPDIQTTPLSLYYWKVDDALREHHISVPIRQYTPHQTVDKIRPQ